MDQTIPDPPKAAPGLSARDKNPSAGRDSKAAAERAAERMGNPKAPVQPPPLQILPFESTLAFVFKNAGGRETAINAARMLEGENEKLRMIVYAWDTATARDKETLKLEDLCTAAGLSADEFLGLVIPALWRRNVDIGKLMVAMSHPQVIEATVRHAQTQWGTQDRQMLHTITGTLPTKAGQQITIDNRKQIVNAGAPPSVKDTSPVGLPAFEQAAIEGAQVLRGDAGVGSAGRKALPAPEIIDAEPVE